MRQRQPLPFRPIVKSAQPAPGRRPWGRAEADGDPITGMIFVTCDEVVNSYSLEDVPKVLDVQEQSPHTCELIELLIHEQYFRKELFNYQPEITDKVIAALEWVTERGYEPCFWCEGLLGNTWGWRGRPGASVG